MRRRLMICVTALIFCAVAVTALGVYWACASAGTEVAALRRVILIGAGAFAAAAVVGGMAVVKLTRPVDPERRPDWPELGPLFEKLDKQTTALRDQRDALEDRGNKLRAITENMTEGLVLTDGAGVVMLMNKAAASLLGVDGAEAVGRHIFAVSQDNILVAAVHMAIGGTQDRELLALGAKRYQVVANPVVVDGAAHGAVLMLIDVTERMAAGDMRREFSANVSHELKTPITTISGYAEMMAGGMVKTEDIPFLSQKIYSEAQRLIALIDDIIKLSRLDEGGGSRPGEVVELLSSAYAACERLEEKAAACGVALTVEGESAPVLGDSRIIDELVTNLADNAIKYNRPGGHAWVTIGHRQGIAVLTVEDDGIGIAPEHMERVFERFYRVDKSRSKDTGGTGLGLSIVKHGAAFLRASIEAESVPDKGTKISIVFDGKG